MAPPFNWDDHPDVSASAGKGAKFSWDAIPDHPDNGAADRSPEALVQGAGNMAAMGYVPELTNAAGKMLPDPNAATDARLRGQGFKITQPAFTGTTTDEARIRQAELAKEEPGSYYAGGAAGALASAPALTAGMARAGLVRAIAPVAADAGFAAKAANLGARANQAMGEGAALGAVQNPNTQPGQRGFNLGARAVNAVETGGMSAGIPVAAAAINSIKPVAQWGATKALSNIGGVKPDVIREYAQFSDRINAAPTVDALKEVSDNFVGKLAADVEAKKITSDQAQAALKDHQADLKSAYQAQGYDARDALTSAKQTLKDAHQERIQQLSGDVYDAVKNLRGDVQSGSAKALETLNNHPGPINLEPVYSQIDTTIQRLKGAGTDEAEAVAGKLSAYKDRLISQNGSAIEAPAAKKLIQGLDQITEYSPMASSFDNAKNAAFKDVRSSMDKTLKSSVPAYAEAMKPVAADADLLSRAGDFGDRQSGAGLLGRITAPNQLERRAALEELGQRNGVDYVAAAQPENLPQQSLVNRAMSIQDSLRPDRVSSKMEQQIEGSRQQAAADTAQSDLSKSKEAMAPFKSLAPNQAGQTTAQQKLTQLGKGGNIELTDMFEKLGKMTDTDFVQAMKDRNTLAAFEKGAYNGSRNTLMGAVAGWAIGGTAGAAGGAAAGRAVDQYGPAITKKILDGAIKVSRNPTVETIMNLKIPDEAKRQMQTGLESYLAQKPKTGPNAWAAEGVKNLGIEDPQLSQRLIADPKAQHLLIQASDMKPGTKAMTNIRNQINQGWGAK